MTSLRTTRPTAPTPDVVPLESLAVLTRPDGPAPSMPSKLEALAAFESPEVRAAELAGWIAEVGGEAAAEALANLWEGARRAAPEALRLLCDLLAVRHPGRELVRQAIRPSQMLRCCLRAGSEASPDGIVRTAARLLTVARYGLVEVRRRPAHALDDLETRAHRILDRVTEDRASVDEATWLHDLVDVELRARALRLEAIAERVGAYDGRRIARLLPLLSREEERIRDTREALLPWPAGLRSRQRVLRLAQRLGAEGFSALQAWLGQDARAEGISRFVATLAAHLPPAAPTRFVTAVIQEVIRRTHGGLELDPARTLLAVVHLLRRGPVVRLGSGEPLPRAVRELAQRLDLAIEGSVLVVEATNARAHRHLAADGTPNLRDTGRDRPVDLREMVLSNVRNEHVLGGLLASPQVAALPGLVEAVVRRTRSVKVLLDVANRRDLYAGHANRGVPLALLQHPTAIPVSALRKFVHVRFVRRADLVALAGRGARVRPEVRRMAQAYLANLQSA